MKKPTKIRAPDDFPASDYWPTRTEAARELGRWFGRDISLNAMAAWLRLPDCPLPPGRGPIPKDVLSKWYEDRFGYAYKYCGSSLVGHELTGTQLRRLDEALAKLQGEGP